MTQYFEKKTIGDFVRSEYDPSSMYCRKQGVIHNRTGGAITIKDPVAYPVKPDSSVAGDFQLCVAGDEAYVTGLIFDPRGIGVDTPLANLATITRNVFVRGPAIIDKSYIATVDTAAAAFTLATIVTALQALVPPIICLPEPATQTTQLY